MTLTGVGGVGKTRLALRAVAGVHEEYPDGIWVLELAALREPSLLAQTVADVFGLPQSLRGAMPPLLDHLRSRRLLLVLDNCEHLLDAVASLAVEVLRSCADVRILATSRQLLGVAGEHAVPVPPMQLPDLEQLPPAGELARWEAPSLFAERAAAVVPDFVVDEGNQTAVAELCHRLDGLPLAIELAAVRLRVLDVEELLKRLEDRFSLLRGGSRAVLPRQQTLQALVDWSYGLCAPQEQLLWARMSVFSRGFDLAAVEAVCSGDGIGTDAVLDLVASLVDKSVLLPYGSCARLGRRYRMLETIREYGRARLAESGREADLLLRHRDHYQALARRARAEWFGADELAWTDRLRVEHANLRVALDFCAAEPGQARGGLELAADLWPYWVCCGLLTEGRHWIDRMLEADPAPTGPRAEALWSAGSLAVLQGDLATGQAQLRECEVLATELGNGVALAWARQYLGLAMLFGGGDLERAAELVETDGRHQPPSRAPMPTPGRSRRQPSRPGAPVGLFASVEVLAQ